MRRTAVLIIIAVLILVPAVVLAQGKAGDAIELLFTDGGAQVGITDTIESVAAVTVEIDGQQYLRKVPHADHRHRHRRAPKQQPRVRPRRFPGGFVRGGHPGDRRSSPTRPRGGHARLLGRRRGKTWLPAATATSCSWSASRSPTPARSRTRWTHTTPKEWTTPVRLFEELDFSCEDINPGETGSCVAVFDVAADVNIVALDIEVTDHRQIAIP